MTAICAIPGLDPANYARSPLHTDDRHWPEKNCYVDIWIELLNAMQLDPRAVLPFVITTGFEGDQCTFFKPPHRDLQDLYGLDVQELTVWKPLIEHAREHLAAGRVISTEADAYWLPDTSGTDYRRNHVKTTVVLNLIDVESKILHYFHNSSYHELRGEDFDMQFRVGQPYDASFLPLYAEFVRVDRPVRKSPSELAAISRGLLQQHFAVRPQLNPFTELGKRLETDLPDFQARGLGYYHLWAFATLRQLGSAFELATLHLQWLSELDALQAAAAAAAFEQISSGCKSLILKGARSVSLKRPLDARAACQTLADKWAEGMAELAGALRA